MVARAAGSHVPVRKVPNVGGTVRLSGGVRLPGLDGSRAPELLRVGGATGAGRAPGIEGGSCPWSPGGRASSPSGCDPEMAPGGTRYRDRLAVAPGRPGPDHEPAWVGRLRVRRALMALRGGRLT